MTEAVLAGAATGLGLIGALHENSVLSGTTPGAPGDAERSDPEGRGTPPRRASAQADHGFGGIHSGQAPDEHRTPRWCAADTSDARGSAPGGPGPNERRGCVTATPSAASLPPWRRVRDGHRCP
jgi:hypothetical protein